MEKVEFSFFLMNTTISLKCIKTDGVSTLDLQEGFRVIQEEFNRIVNKFTRFNENSELSNLNRSSGKWCRVGEELFFLVKYMVDLSVRTNFVFDPTVIDFLEVYGYDKNYDFSKLENPALDSLVRNIRGNRKSVKEILFDEANFRIFLAKGQRLDLGGIGKGYAVDCAFEKLKNLFDNFLIDAGGDIRASGKNEFNNFWKVILKVPDLKVFPELELKNEAIASSGSWARKVGNFHHLIDVKTGNPAVREYSTVFVKAGKCLDADAWATILFLDKSLQNLVEFDVAYF